MDRDGGVAESSSSSSELLLFGKMELPPQMRLVQLGEGAVMADDTPGKPSQPRQPAR